MTNLVSDANSVATSGHVRQFVKSGRGAGDVKFFQGDIGCKKLPKSSDSEESVAFFSTSSSTTESGKKQVTHGLRTSSPTSEVSMAASPGSGDDSTNAKKPLLKRFSWKSRALSVSSSSGRSSAISKKTYDGPSDLRTLWSVSSSTSRDFCKKKTSSHVSDAEVNKNDKSKPKTKRSSGEVTSESLDSRTMSSSDLKSSKGYGASSSLPKYASVSSSSFSTSSESKESVRYVLQNSDVQTNLEQTRSSGLSSHSSSLPHRKPLRLKRSENQSSKSVESRRIKIRPDTSMGRFVRPGFFLMSKNKGPVQRRSAKNANRTEIVQANPESEQVDTTSLIEKKSQRMEKKETAMVSYFDSVVMVTKNKNSSLAINYEIKTGTQDETSERIPLSGEETPKSEGSGDMGSAEVTRENSKENKDELEVANIKSMVLEDSPPIFRKGISEKAKSLGKARKLFISEPTDSKKSEPLPALISGTGEEEKGEDSGPGILLCDDKPPINRHSNQPSDQQSEAKKTSSKQNIKSSQGATFYSKTEKCRISVTDVVVSC